MLSVPLWVYSLVVMYGIRSTQAARVEGQYAVEQISKRQTQMARDINTIKKIVSGLQGRSRSDCGNHGNGQLTDDNGDTDGRAGGGVKSIVGANHVTKVETEGKSASIAQIITQAKAVAARGGRAELGLMDSDGKPMSYEDPRFKAVMKRLIARGFPASLLTVGINAASGDMNAAA